MLPVIGCAGKTSSKLNFNPSPLLTRLNYCTTYGLWLKSPFTLGKRVPDWISQGMRGQNGERITCSFLCWGQFLLGFSRSVVQHGTDMDRDDGKYLSLRSEQLFSSLFSPLSLSPLHPAFVTPTLYPSTTLSPFLLMNSLLSTNLIKSHFFSAFKSGRTRWSYSRRHLLHRSRDGRGKEESECGHSPVILR